MKQRHKGIVDLKAAKAVEPKKEQLEIVENLVSRAKVSDSHLASAELVKILLEYEQDESSMSIPRKELMGWLESFLELKREESLLLKGISINRHDKITLHDKLLELGSYFNLKTTPEVCELDIQVAEKALKTVSNMETTTNPGDYKTNFLIQKLLAFRKRNGLRTSISTDPYSDSNDPKGEGVKWIQAAVEQISGKTLSPQAVRERIKQISRP